SRERDTLRHRVLMHLRSLPPEGVEHAEVDNDLGRRIKTALLEKKSLLGVTKKLPSSIQSLKDISESIQTTKIALEEEDIENILKSLDAFIDTNKMGGMMIDQFLEDHREIRLLKVRLEDKGIEYLKENKEKINSLFENLEITVTKKIRN
ncbi:MAG: hypothetical protein LV468_05285, partial [Candidatus Nitrosotenuis sp.]|nr:hypothetical protein [Candidatus Nitrosotenuis sp.]